MTTLAEALAPRSDQLNADDLIAGPRTLVFTSGRIIKEGRDTKLVLNYEGDNGKPWKPCKTMGRAMVVAWGLTDENFAKRISGKAVRAYRDPTVDFGSDKGIGGIRISHMSHIDKPVSIKLTVSQGKRGLFTFAPLPSEVAQRPRQTADEWAAEHIAAVQEAADSEALEAIIKRGVGAVKKLHDNGNAWAGKIAEAYDARRGQIEREGRPDDGFGDGTDEADEA